MLKYLKLLRINQWAKNVFIFAPLFFAFKFTDIHAILNAFYAFIGFSFIASSIYIINDLKDIDSDKQHPTKRYRPLAAGTISRKNALVIFGILLILGFSSYICILKNTTATTLLFVYFILNIAYSLKLKQISIVDITIVALGFVIRLFIGSVVTNITLSYWIIILTFLLALLLVIGKRRHDVIIFEETNKKMRNNISSYNLEFLNSTIVIIISTILISYIMYTISPVAVDRNGEFLYLTALFVFLGLFRYLQAIFVEKKGDSPTRLLTHDKFLQIDIILWVISFITISIHHKYF